jgi:preprotein translocase subunit Sss1
MAMIAGNFIKPDELKKKIESEADFQPLLSRPDFQEFLQSLK